MYDLFIALTDQLFWEGYAEQLAKDIKELETETRLSIPSTKNVKVLKAELLNTHQKT